MAEQSKYEFLEVLRESDAIARGANLSDKINHAVFRAIQKASTPTAVRSGNLFTLDSFVPDIVNLTKAELKTVLQRLIGENVIAQIFRLEFSSGKIPLILKPCFICAPTNEKHSMLQLYNETIYQSILAIESYLDSLGQNSTEGIWMDFETDFNSEKTPVPEAIPSSVVDIFSVIHPGNFNIVPQGNLIPVSIEEIEGALIKKNKIVIIIDYGIMPLREQEILDRLDTATAFLKRKILPKYRNKSNLKRDMEQIDLEEACYQIDQNAPGTAEFVSKKANAIKKTVLNVQDRQGTRYPGALAIETIISLESFAQKEYNEIQKKGMMLK